jgi:dTDP-4-amino-4,6-dideoxygalactose transaminase
MKIPYGKQNIIKKDIDAVVDVLKSEFITQGSKVSEFEALFAYYVGAKYSVAVSSGTAALHLANIAVGTKTGNKVLTSPISFVATSNSVLYCGGEVDFVDIDPHTFLIDLNKLEEKLRRNRKSVYSGIIPVDFAGLPVNVENLRYIANKYNLWIIEDACHAPGGYFFDSKGIKQYCGNGVYSDLQIFSFHPVKHIAAGEGGMITTNNKRLYEQIVRLRNHGIIRNSHNWAKNIEGWYYEMQELGYNYRLSDINCALAVSQLKRAGDGIKKRNEIAKNIMRHLLIWNK